MIIKKNLEEVDEAKNNRTIVNFESSGSENQDFKSKTYDYELSQRHSNLNKSKTYNNFISQIQ